MEPTEAAWAGARGEDLEEGSAEGWGEERETAVAWAVVGEERGRVRSAAEGQGSVAARGG